MHTLPEEREAENGYDLFYRAIAERDDNAWAEIAVRYRSLLVAWARRAAARSSVTEPPEDIADQALARAWIALANSNGCGFPTLAAALGYLRTCVTAVAIDLARAQASRSRLQLQLELGATPNPEQEVMENLAHTDVWQMMSGVVGCEQERVVLHAFLVLGLASREILAQHPRLFDNVEDVYRTKRNLFSRLQRHPELRRMWEQR
jgi:DNA-directed RNA polymerase specialized sigma24 family protein